MSEPTPVPTFDADGYPTRDTLTALRLWPETDVASALDFLKAAWHWPEMVREWLSISEHEIVGGKPSDRFLRLATGGWSGNEALMNTFHQTFMHVVSWQLSARGGLYIYKYPVSR